MVFVVIYLSCLICGEWIVFVNFFFLVIGVILVFVCLSFVFLSFYVGVLLICKICLRWLNYGKNICFVEVWLCLMMIYGIDFILIWGERIECCGNENDVCDVWVFEVVLCWVCWEVFLFGVWGIYYRGFSCCDGVWRVGGYLCCLWYVWCY